MLISIITVSFNSAKTIEETIQSVLGQDYPSIEYIIIDGASTDGTKDILSRYDNIHVISEPDKGMYDAMNKGINLAKGDIIGILNADDLYADKNIISTISKAFQDPSIDACYGDLVYFSSDTPNKIVRYWKSRSFLPGLFSWGWNPPHPTFFVRREIYQRLGNFDTSFTMGNDIELMMRFLEKHQIRTTYIPRLMVKMRLGGVSNQSIKNIVLQNKNILMAAKKLKIPMSSWTFVVGKIVNRLSQFLLKGRSAYYHAN